MELLTLSGALTGLAIWLFWPIAILAVCIVSYLTKEERWGLCSIWIAVLTVITCAWFKVPIHVPTSTDLGEIAKWVGKYLGVGIVWAFVSWWQYNRQSLKEYKEARSSFLAANATDCFTEDLRKEWAEILNGTSDRSYHYFPRYRPVEIPPLAPNHKTSIGIWIILWPFSILGSLFSQMFRQLVTFIVDSFGAVFNGISNFVFRSVPQDAMTARELADYKTRTQKTEKKWK